MANKVIKSSLDKKGIEYYPITTANAVIHTSKHKTIDVITDDLDKKSITIPYYAEFESGGTVSVPISDFEKDLGISWEDFCKYTTTVDILADSSMVGGETNENYIDTAFTKHFTMYFSEIEGGGVEGVAFHKMNNFQLSWDYEEEDPPEPILQYQILEFYRQDEYIQINQHETSCYDEVYEYKVKPDVDSINNELVRINEELVGIDSRIDEINPVYIAENAQALFLTHGKQHSIGVIPKIEYTKSQPICDTLNVVTSGYAIFSSVDIYPIEHIDLNSEDLQNDDTLDITFQTFTPTTSSGIHSILRITYNTGDQYLDISYPRSNINDEQGDKITTILKYNGEGDLIEFNQNILDAFQNSLKTPSGTAGKVGFRLVSNIDEIKNNYFVQLLSYCKILYCSIQSSGSTIYTKNEFGWQEYYGPIKNKSITSEKLSDNLNSIITQYNIPINWTADNMETNIEYNSNEHFNISEDHLKHLRRILSPENASNFYINKITIDLKSGDDHVFTPLSTIYNSSVENESGELENWINFVFIIYSEEYNRKFIVSFNEENYIKLKVYEF